ncbi:MAG: bi-domain-containing oxidoreductase, partial [Phycisphaerae bacterium]
MGYCNVGRVVQVGDGVTGFKVGDRVASNGSHAEMVAVPANLCVRIPDEVSDEEATFTVLGAIALQGVRLLNPTFGESFVVTGLGLIGLFAVQLLRSSGCRVLGLDYLEDKCDIARTYGADAVCLKEGADPVSAAEDFTRGIGVDGVLITASSKGNDTMVHDAATMCRKRGRIVLLGTANLKLDRADFYAKELSFQVSCSYGPGRYDSNYEDKGIDYPLPFVRWTQNRNFEAILGGMAEGWIDVEPLISDRIPIADGERAFDKILKDSSALGVVLTYPDQPPPLTRAIPVRRVFRAATEPTAARVAVIGTGSFSRQVLLPALKEAGADLVSVVSAGGVTGVHAGRKFDAQEAATDYRAVLQKPNVSTVFITTRHNSHANMVIESLDAGKHVFVEKPLAIDRAQLDAVSAAAAKHPNKQIMVGFNRRFAPHAVAIHKALHHRAAPIAINCLVNAGFIPADNWNHDPTVGGGRIIGEGCHFIDLLMFLVGAPITSVSATAIGTQDGRIIDDNTSISLTFADGSIGSIHYWANGGKSFPKEKVEVFSEGRVAVIDNWRTLKCFDWPNGPRLKTKQDKGHRAEIAQFIHRIQHGGEPLIPYHDLEMVTLASFAAVEAARTGERIAIQPKMDA